MPDGAPPAAEATRADADLDDELELTHQFGPRHATESKRHVITDAPDDFELLEAKPTLSIAATPTAANEQSANSNSANHYALHKRARRQSNANAKATVLKSSEKACHIVEQAELKTPTAAALSEASSNQLADANSPGPGSLASN